MAAVISIAMNHHVNDFFEYYHCRYKEMLLVKVVLVLFTVEKQKLKVKL